MMKNNWKITFSFIIFSPLNNIEINFNIEFWFLEQLPNRHSSITMFSGYSTIEQILKEPHIELYDVTKPN